MRRGKFNVCKSGDLVVTMDIYAQRTLRSVAFYPECRRFQGWDLTRGSDFETLEITFFFEIQVFLGFIRPLSC